MQSIDVLLATYRPNLSWLEEQLRSLEAQDYPHVRLLLLDDGGDPGTFQEIRALADRVLLRLPYCLQQNAENTGVTRTFERLTQMAEADLVAYCDQDDIWEPNKLSTLAALMGEQVTLSYCNMSIIDGQSKQLYPTLQDLRRRFTHLHGDELFGYFLTDNCVTGMTMLMQRTIAQAALPFPAAYVHDNWLALCAAAAGTIAYRPEPLVRYRLHGGNQIGMASLSGVDGRESYVTERLLPLEDMLESPELARFGEKERQAEIQRQRVALAARIKFLQTRHGWRDMARLCKRDPVRLAFETLLGLLPRGMGARLVRFGQEH